MGQITEYDCNCSCRHETTQRRSNFQSQVRIDNAENFGKMTYRILKAKPCISLDEVPYQMTTNARLLRSTKGLQQIKTDDFCHFPKGSHLFFGEATIQVIEQSHCVVSFRVIAGSVPSQAILICPKVAITSEEIALEFRKFWTPMWLRDTYTEQFQPETWESFAQELDTTPIPPMQVSIDLSDPKLWDRAIKGLKDHKAHGICGWRHEELKALPFR